MVHFSLIKDFLSLLTPVGKRVLENSETHNFALTRVSKFQSRIFGFLAFQRKVLKIFLCAKNSRNIVIKYFKFLKSIKPPSFRNKRNTHYPSLKQNKFFSEHFHVFVHSKVGVCSLSMTNFDKSIFTFEAKTMNPKFNEVL